MKIIFIDGDCLFCHGLVQFLERYAKEQFHFAKLQGEFAKKSLPQKYIKDLNSVVFLENLIIHTKSEAILKIVENLNTPYNLVKYILKCIPTFFINLVYDHFAKRRSLISKNYCQSISVNKNAFID